MKRWKLVKDELPILAGYYLVAFQEFGFSGRYIGIAVFLQNEEGVYGFVITDPEYKEFTITHWMSLPEPPKEKP